MVLSAYFQLKSSRINLRYLCWAMRFWILRLSLGSITSVQSRSSLGPDFDFLDKEEEELPFWGLPELCSELLAILLFLGSTSGVSRCAVLEDLFFLCLRCSSCLWDF